MLKNISLIALTLAGLSACTISLTPEALLLPDADNLRFNTSTLTIEGEERLRGRTTLRHEWIESASGPVALTWAQNESETGGERLIVHCMGNTTDRLTDGVDYLEGLIPFGDAIIFDYPGFGDSAGTPSLENFRSGLVALQEKVEAAAYSEIILWGHSLGGYMCAELARTLQSDAIIFETTTSLDVLKRNALTWYQKPFIRLKIDPRLLAIDNIDALSNFDGPVLVIAAGKDKELPLRLVTPFVDDLEASGRNVSYLEFAEAGHYDVSTQADYQQRLSAFFAQLQD